MRMLFISTLLVVTGCAGSVDNRDNYLLFGTSNVQASAAVGDVSVAIDNARTLGCEPISTGGGTGAATVPGEPGQRDRFSAEFDVYVIVSCPEGTPALLPETGLPTP